MESKQWREFGEYYGEMAGVLDAIKPGDMPSLREAMQAITAWAECEGNGGPHFVCDEAILRFVGIREIADWHDKLAAWYE